MTPRCVVKGCPVRFATGADRPCREHREDGDLNARMEAFTAMSAIPGAHDGDLPDAMDGGDGRRQAVTNRHGIPRR